MAQPSREESLDLVRDVMTGSVPAWHRFVDGYAGIIHSTVHRYLATASVDDRRDRFVEVLDKLRSGTLAHYDGRSALSTWLFIFTRSRCLDHLRSKHGRRSLPGWLRRLSPVDQRVFELYYLRGLGCREVRSTLVQQGVALSLDQLAESLERLDAKLDEGTRRRMAYDLFAQSVGASSGRLLALVHHLVMEAESRVEASSVEQQQLERELVQVTRWLGECVDRLPDLERRVVVLRFYDGRTARDVAHELGLDGARRVYTLEDRALQRLKAMLEWAEGRDGVGVSR